MRRRAFLLALVLLAGCVKHAPVEYYADFAINVLGNIQHVAIGMNAIPVCDTQAPPVCHPLLSKHDTQEVKDAVTDGVKVIRVAPFGWRAAADAALDRIIQRLEADGRTRLASYLEAARAALAAVTQ